MKYEEQSTALSGCPWRDASKLLGVAGLRPTRQRIGLSWLLFGKGDRHLTAEMLFEEAMRVNIPVSLATIYNTLNHLTNVGLLRQVNVGGGSKAYFDTNTSSHQHFYIEGSNELVDITDDDFVLRKVPDVPAGFEIAHIDMVVRLREKKSLLKR